MRIKILHAEDDLMFSHIVRNLLEKNGFVREGYAYEYLCINGTWQDHLLFARLKDGPRDRLKDRPEP